MSIQKFSRQIRREQRVPANASVVVTIVGMLGEPRAMGTVMDMSGSGLRLKMPNPIPCGAPVRVETGEMLMLAEVVRCEPAGLTHTVALSVSELRVKLATPRR